MEQAELEQIIETARVDRVSKLSLDGRGIAILPDCIGNMTESKYLYLSCNNLVELPSAFGNLINLNSLHIDENEVTDLPVLIENLFNLSRLSWSLNKINTFPKVLYSLENLSQLNLSCNRISLPDDIDRAINLTELDLSSNELESLPENIGNLSRLTILDLSCNRIKNLPDNIKNLTNLTELYLQSNQLSSLPESIGDLVNLTILNIQDNYLTDLPIGFDKLCNLTDLHISNMKFDSSFDNPHYSRRLRESELLVNQMKDLSILQKLPNLKKVIFGGVKLPRRYWTKLSDWRSKWLLDETNAEIRHRLIEQIGYERINEDLGGIVLNMWRDYTLITIDNVEIIRRSYDIYHNEIINSEPMVLLKMTCPSTGHIHILRVPPEMTSAEAAITWVNHGIHPDEFAVQT
jgi:leucine-rich repeat protein SHOC2